MTGDEDHLAASCPGRAGLALDVVVPMWWNVFITRDPGINAWTISLVEMRGSVQASRMPSTSRPSPHRHHLDRLRVVGAALSLPSSGEPVRYDRKDTTVGTEGAIDAAAAARHERFGTLPERIRYEEMVEEREAAPNGLAPDSYNPEGSWNHFSCLALDLGL